MNEAGANSVSGHRKRLKERFLNSSLSGFHDYEAIELLLMYAIPRRDVKPLAKELLARFDGLSGLLDAPVEELIQVPGIGENAAKLLSLVRSTGRAYLNEQAGTAGVVTCAEDAIKLLERSYEGQAEGERLYAIYLNSKNDVLGIENLHNGPLSEASLSPRDIVEKALKHNARSLLLLHRVASEFAFPVMFDRSMAEGLVSAATAIDIIVHDYIVVADESHLSGREFGLLNIG